MVHEGSRLRCWLGNTYFQRQSRVCTHMSSFDIFILYRHHQKNLTLITAYNLRFVTDATVAVFIAVLLFVLPSKAPRFCPGRSRSFEPGAVWETQPVTHLNMLRTSCIGAHGEFIGSAATTQGASSAPRLLSWKVVQKKLPWGIVLLLGGGFALAKGSEVSKNRLVNLVWFKNTCFCGNDELTPQNWTLNFYNTIMKSPHLLNCLCGCS